jgi:steroid delta-isomerase-like uncharacterized protein
MATRDEMRRLYETHIDAENRADLEGVLATFGDDCFIDNVPLQTRIEGKHRVGAAYNLLFQAFPDSDRRLEGEAWGDDIFVGWGMWRGTMHGGYMGVSPTGRSIDLPFATFMSFADGLIRGERVFYDLATMCEQAGIPLDALRAAARTG